MKHYDNDGNVISLEKWCEICETPGANTIDKTEVRDIRVSTICLGIDHNFGRREDELPIIYETMLFGISSDKLAEGREPGLAAAVLSDDREYQWRYSTRAEAEAHHLQIVAALQRGEAPGDAP